MNELKTIKEIAEKIHEQGGTVYFVGGYIRDQLLNKQNKDIDVEIHGISVYDTKQILKDYGEVDEIGASFGVLMVKGLDIDFCFPREESMNGSKHTDFEVSVNPFLGLEKACRRRDFTMNAIMQNVITGEYVDLFGGIQDIQNKQIREVDKRTFVEDSLRVFRACQFSARLGFTIADSVVELSHNMTYDLSRERITEELNKGLMKSDKPSIMFNELDRCGVIDKLFPELSELKSCKQNPEFHPEGNVWNHVMMVVDEGAKKREKANVPKAFMYACLLHDIGKPKTTMPDSKGIIRALGHAEQGEPLAKDFIMKWLNEPKTAEYVGLLTRFHMTAHKLLELKDSKLRKLMISCDTHDLLLLNYCDIGGREYSSSNTKRITEYQERLDKVQSLSNGEFGQIVPYLQGRDLIKMGVPQGKEIGKYLQLAYNEQLNGRTKSQVLKIIENKINPERDLSETDYLSNLVKQSLGSDKQKLETHGKYVSRLEKMLKDYKFPIKFKKKEGLIYSLVIILIDNKPYKLFLLPDMFVLADVRLAKQQVFSVHHLTEQERLKALNNLLQNYTGNKSNFEIIYKIYSKLNRKIV